MGFKKLSDKDLKGVDGLREFAEKDFNPEYLTQHVSVVQSLMDHYRKERATAIGHSELGVNQDDQMINLLHHIIRGAVRVLAVLMVLTILWGVIDVLMVLYSKILLPSYEDLRPRDIIVVFGAFLAVLIAIEIFMNLKLYLRDDVVHMIRAQNHIPDTEFVSLAVQPSNFSRALAASFEDAGFCPVTSLPSTTTCEAQSAALE
jgi:hypothetical protein